ncbi:MAG: hypothetical protein ACYDD2_11220 [Candidatus Acidiferrales bacterium]
MAVSTTKFPAHGARSRSLTQRATSTHNSKRPPSDDEILGLVTTVQRPAAMAGDDDSNFGGAATDTDNAANSDATSPSGSDAASHSGGATNSAASDSTGNAAMPEALAKLADADPQVRQVLQDAQAYHAAFPSPQAAQDAKNQLDELDGMFFSAQPADHAKLAARIHDLSPEAFQNFAHAVQAHAAKVGAEANPASSVDGPAAAGGMASDASSESHAANSSGDGSQTVATQNGAPAVSRETDQIHSSQAAPAHHANAAAQTTPRANHAAPQAAASPSDPRRAAQIAFFHDTNAAAVEHILGAIHTQVNRLLPDSVPAGTRNRIVGEVYREIDSTLRANRQLGKQLREAFQAGAGDSAHQRAIVTLVAGRAKQALPSVAKRVIGEWTQSIVAANRERLSRHEAASKRVDIAGGGSSDGVNRKPISPRDVDYRRLSDADILNL